MNLLYCFANTGCRPIHLIHKTYPRNVVSICLPPDSLGLRLNPVYPVKQNHSSIQNLERPFYFNGKIHVSRGINDIDAAVLPETGSARSEERRVGKESRSR